MSRRRPSSHLDEGDGVLVRLRHGAFDARRRRRCRGNKAIVDGGGPRQAFGERLEPGRPRRRRGAGAFALSAIATTTILSKVVGDRLLFRKCYGSGIK